MKADTKSSGVSISPKGNGGHVDRPGSSGSRPMTSVPASGSVVPAHKVKVLGGYKGHQNNADTHTAADKREANHGHLNGGDVIAAQGE